MKSKLILVIVGILTLGLIVGVLVLVFSKDMAGNDEVEELFEAQMEAISGDNSKVEGLGYDTDYASQTKDIIEVSGFRNSGEQSDAADRAISEFTYEIKDIETVEDGDTVTYKLTYEIDSYPIVGLMDEYLSNAGDYLSAEEYEVFMSDSGEDKTQVITKLLDLYYENLPTVEPVRVEHTIEYVVEDEILVLGIEDFEDVVKIILGISNVGEVVE